MAHRPWLIALATGLVAGFAGGVAVPALAEGDPYAGLETFGRVLTQIEAHYVEDIDQDELIEAAIEGMTTRLDPHSRWLDPQETRDLQDDTEGRYEGIGVEVRVVPEGLRVMRVMSGGPAERDGVLPEDRIVSIDGQAIAGLDLDQTARLLRGERGTPVVLTVQRPGVERPVQLRTIRDRIDVQSVESGPLPGDVAYVHLRGFQVNAARDVERAARQLLKEGHDAGLILDLRGNPGGLLEEAIALSDLFLDEGPIVTTRGRTEGEVVREATRGGLPRDLAVVVLVDQGSASASEVVTGALQDTDRATVVGTRTYGKGSVQTLFHSRDGHALKLTIARYYTPAGTPVAPESGREPDVVVPFTPADDPVQALRTRVASLDEADRAELLALVDALPESPTEEPILPWDEPVESRWKRDPQLRAALSALGVEATE